MCLAALLPRVSRGRRWVMERSGIAHREPLGPDAEAPRAEGPYLERNEV